jgi:hypothetical protein
MSKLFIVSLTTRLLNQVLVKLEKRLNQITTGEQPVGVLVKVKYSSVVSSSVNKQKRVKRIYQ